MYSLYIFSFIFGVIIGSFLNVIVYRYNTGKTIGGRSQCFSCGKKLEPIELIPILSFLLQKGKCRKCKSIISIQYPLVEFMTGILFVLGVMKFFPLIETDSFSFIIHSLLYFTIVSVLVVIFVYDLRHKIIPDGLSFTVAGLLFIYFVFTRGVAAFTTPAGLISLLIGLLIAFALFFLWFVSKGTWIGLGDAKLVIGYGWMLGAVGAASAIVISFWIGAVISILLLVIAKTRIIDKTWLRKINLKTEIPFAPFLIIGLLLVFFFNWDVMHIRELMLLF